VVATQGRGERLERFVVSALIVLGLGQLGLAAWQAFWPGTFFRGFAAFGTRNDHYIRDVATFYFALGAVLLIAARRPRWRIPVLFFAVLQYALHLVNHLIDIGNSHPGWIGPVDALALAIALAVFVAVLRMAVRARTGAT
jgi:hypothetical protein